MNMYRVITGQLVSRTAVHIGAGEGNDTTDALLYRDARGNLLIPGTAIAGALRSLLTRLAPRFCTSVCKALDRDDGQPCTCHVCRLFGDVNPSNEIGKKVAASRVLVYNAQFSGAPTSTQIRDGVGIDRVSRTSARTGAVKFDLETIPAGSTCELRLELRGTNAEDEQLLAAGLAEWQAGRVWLGGRVARGLGAFDLRNIRLVTRNLNDSNQLMSVLKADKPWEDAPEVSDWLSACVGQLGVSPSPTDKPLPLACRWVSAEFILQAEGPLLTHDATTHGLSGFDYAPLLASLQDWKKPGLSGAGLRGVLRSHAERIARTLATQNAVDEQDFLKKCPACDPLARRTRKDDTTVGLESCDSLLRYEGGICGDEEVTPQQLCLACRLFGSTRLGSRFIVEDAPFMGDEPVYKMLDFLAIDRFTGGGAERLKFDAVVLWQPQFIIRLHLDNPAEWELGWLALVLRDLRDGWLSVGFGMNKGLGRVRIADGWSLHFGFLSDDDAPAKWMSEAVPRANSGVYRVTEYRPADAQKWLALAETWVERFNQAVSEFLRSEELSLRADSYFGQVDAALYPPRLEVKRK